MVSDQVGQVIFTNSALRVSVNPDDLSGTIVPLSGPGGGWRFAPLEHLRASTDHSGSLAWTLLSISVMPQDSEERQGIDAIITVSDNRYRLRVLIESSAPEVHFDVEPLDEPTPMGSLTFPGPLLPNSGMVTHVVLPKMLTNGVLHRPREEDHWTHTMDVASQAGLNMPWWGLDSNDGGLVAILETADDVTLEFEKSTRRSIEVAPTWTASLGHLRYGRRLRVRLLDQGGYVNMAKAYKRYVVDRGRFKTLAEKIAERPIVKQLVGGPYFSVGYLPFTDRKFRQITTGLRDLGYTNGIIGPISHIQWESGRWLNDYQPFIDAPHFKDIARNAGFAAFAWLYLEDILRWDPYFDKEWLVRDADGEIREGWFNQDYEYFLICTKRLLEQHTTLKDRMIAFEALHFDTTTAKSLTECWDSAHPMTKTEDRESRRQRFKEVASWNLLIGSESGFDWAFDTYDFCSSNPRRAMETGLPFEATHIPLLGLVYHESVVSYCWEYDPYNKSYFGGDWFLDKLLYDAMAGNPPTISPVLGYFPVIRRPPPPIEAHWVTWEDPETQRILRDALPIARLHGRTAHTEMLDHRYLDEMNAVSQTSYADGTEVIVNFGPEQSDGGGSVPLLEGLSYLVR